MVDQRYYTVQEASETLSVDDETILAWIHSGELIAINITKTPGSKRPTWRIGERELGLVLLARSNARKASCQVKRTRKPKTVQCA